MIHCWGIFGDIQDSQQLSTTYQPKATENYGEGDFWVVKLNKEGKVEWEKSFGGKEDDHIRTLANTDTGFIIAGESRSSNSVPTKDGGALVGIYSRSSKMENGKIRTEKESSLDEEPKEETNLANNQPSTKNHQQTTKESNSSILIPTTYQPKTTEHDGEGNPLGLY